MFLLCFFHCWLIWWYNWFVIFNRRLLLFNCLGWLFTCENDGFCLTIGEIFQYYLFDLVKNIISWLLRLKIYSWILICYLNLFHLLFGFFLQFKNLLFNLRKSLSLILFWFWLLLFFLHLLCLLLHIWIELIVFQFKDILEWFKRVNLLEMQLLKFGAFLLLFLYWKQLY